MYFRPWAWNEISISRWKCCWIPWKSQCLCQGNFIYLFLSIFRLILYFHSRCIHNTLGGGGVLTFACQKNAKYLTKTFVWRFLEQISQIPKRFVFYDSLISGKWPKNAQINARESFISWLKISLFFTKNLIWIHRAIQKNCESAGNLQFLFSRKDFFIHFSFSFCN